MFNMGGVQRFRVGPAAVFIPPPPRVILTPQVQVVQMPIPQMGMPGFCGVPGFGGMPGGMPGFGGMQGGMPFGGAFPPMGGFGPGFGMGQIGGGMNNLAFLFLGLMLGAALGQKGVDQLLEKLGLGHRPAAAEGPAAARETQLPFDNANFTQGLGRVQTIAAGDEQATPEQRNIAKNILNELQSPNTTDERRAQLCRDLEDLGKNKADDAGYDKTKAFLDKEGKDNKRLKKAGSIRGPFNNDEFLQRVGRLTWTALGNGGATADQKEKAQKLLKMLFNSSNREQQTWALNSLQNDMDPKVKDDTWAGDGAMKNTHEYLDALKIPYRFDL